MSTMTIDRIGVWSLAKFYATMLTVFALILGFPALVVGTVLGGGVGIAAYIGGVITAVIGGLIAGAVSALVYNFIATLGSSHRVSR
ncbi:MAG: hypothetical protein ABEI11_00095 [Haloarculaceae archaeon]